ncbi:putative photosynthetic complex assembly protein PuhE [Jannaschia aquimarina]|uniref:Photosynthetic complex assembly protein 2 n=1 Tax=Jannaschia aquimarina TaxID=935700 RepID=A0A0D1D493_9RHOB|nr:putative photosynthetic complex assembly protein PuhE [Jannaschia aquimarina]KIT14878.1 hypothetical protein jaqu_32030 [Jannaschia aquimarina]SNS58192.1 putative photosynthetic complex assembly protein 2 [Jannaschia aquimarina]
MLLSPWIAGAVALVAWWVSTGAILWAVRRADLRGRHVALTLGTLPILGLGFWGLWATRGVLDPAEVYLAAASALAVWGWIELAFLTGMITGPNTRPARPGVPGWERFIRAWGTVAYHEMTLTAALIAIIALTHDAANTFGLWIFAVLYAARISAKLNLYLGVRKVNTEFIPSSLRHLPSHFGAARMNWLFPTSVTALTFAVACWLERLIAAPAPAQEVGFALLAALTALALLEHWFMVVPLPDEKLWRWMLPDKQEEGTDAVR